MKISRQFVVLAFVCATSLIGILRFSALQWSRPGILMKITSRPKVMKISAEPEVSTMSSTIRFGTDSGKDSMHTTKWTTESFQNDTCEPYHQIVFVKTHKTASTTANTIIQRYGYEHNLTFALPKKGGKFSFTSLFNRRMVASQSGQNETIAKPAQYNVIANHGRFNKLEMLAVVPDARFLTILREPVAKCESTFGYYNMAKSLELNKYELPFEKFSEDPEGYFQRKPFMYFQLKNGMMYSLGLDHADQDNTSKVESKIREVEKEFDLVLLTEYFDESLLLMRKLLCWNEDDILYLPKGIRSTKLRYEINPKVREKILKWNAADVKLYNHFNETFWRKVREYGPSFESDLKHFRERQRAVYNECIDEDAVVRSRDTRENFLALREDASKFCVVLYGRVDFFINEIRKRQTA